jgi:hypothetical protein
MGGDEGEEPAVKRGALRGPAGKGMSAFGRPIPIAVALLPPRAVLLGSPKLSSMSLDLLEPRATINGRSVSNAGAAQRFALLGNRDASARWRARSPSMRFVMP